MADVTEALAAKSDQLNAVDLAGAEPVIKIRAVEVKKTPTQKIWVYFDGDNNRPWKPCVGMCRALAQAWGNESDAWVGKSVKLFVEPSVMWSGKPVGGIEIAAISDIDPNGIDVIHVKNKHTRVIRHFPCLTVQTSEYPQDRFDKALPVIVAKMQNGEMTLQQVIAQCQKTGTLNEHQLKCLQDAEPSLDDDDEETM